MRVPAAIYFVVCSLLWMLPLFRLLHVESSAVIAGVSFFVAGLSAIQYFNRGLSLQHVLIRHLLLLLLPLGMLTISLLWQPNCEYAQGLLLFFLLFPGITVIFAVCLAFAVQRKGLRRPSLGYIGLGILIILAGPIYDIGLHAQFFTYNHVFGGVMGPIYDEEIKIRSGLILFRGLTLLWALLFLFIGLHFQSDYALNLWKRVARAGTVLGIGAIYLFSASLQINSPSWYIEKELGGHLATEHFDIYYDPETTSPFLLYKFEHDHEFRYAQLKDIFGFDVKQRIKSFVYPDPYRKEDLTGARFTNVAPVWLRIPQLHIYADAFDRVFTHELIHVFSREFGLPVINASLSVGLVEGLAVALEPSEGRPMPHEQVLTAALVGRKNVAESELGIASQVEGSLSPFGFWTGRGAVSYITMGSFVRYLIDTYGIEPIMDVYAYSNFEEVYGKPASELTAEWEAYLGTLPVVARATSGYVTRRFSVPSLFEQRCPHHVPPAVRAHRESLVALAASDTTMALRYLEEALAIEPMYQLANETWSQLHLGLEQPDSVITRMNRLFSGEQSAFRTPLMWMWLGDAYAMLGEEDAAIAAYTTTQERLPLYLHDQVGFMELRKALLDYPELHRLFLIPQPYTDKIDRLHSGSEPEGLRLFMAVIMHTRAQQMDDARIALDALDMTTIPGERVDVRLIERYLRMKKADVYFQAGAIDAALQEAGWLHQELNSVGALPEADFYADFANKMRYINRAQ